MRFVLSFCLFVCLSFLWWTKLSEVVILSADDWVCICFVCCLNEVSCTGCYWWLGDARSCNRVVSFVWVLTIWYSAPHSSTLAWKIPWMEEPGRLQSTGSLGVGHDWVTSLSLFTFIHWRRKWQPTPVFLPGESQGWRSLVGCHLWGCTESDTTEVT